MEELGLPCSVIEGGPRRGEKNSFAVTFTLRPKLALDLIWREEIIGIKPLDVVPLAEPQRVIAGSRSTLVPHRDDRYLPGSKPSANLCGPIFGAIVHNYDLLARPGLGYRGLDRMGDPLFGVICRDENRD
jgi:hypothetical protein